MNKLATLVSICLLTGFSAAGQCLWGDCQSGKGIMVYSNGDRYIGTFYSGKKQGEGVYYYRNGSRYQGQWAKDMPNGNGWKSFQDGTRLQGFWESGKLIRRQDPGAGSDDYSSRGADDLGCVSGNCTNGKGIYIYPSGAVYIGEFQNGEIHGVGMCYYSDGSKYQGEWAHRYPEGRGTKSYPDGSARTGYWKKGQPVDEFGNLQVEIVNSRDRLSDGTEIQSGCLSGDCAGGQGVFAYSDGSRYEGQFYQGRPEGWGTFFYIDGRKYVGTFQKGVPHGHGRLERPDGPTQTGEWRNGEYLGQTALTRTAGCLEGDCLNGYGAYLFSDGSKYIGTFKNGLADGRGTVFYPNGERYEGEMAEAAFQGEGTFFLADGSQIRGRWSRGTYLGAPAIPPAQNGNAYSAFDPFNSNRPPAPAPAPARTPKVWAVIIGVASYHHMPVLRYTDDDAYRVYAFLKSPEGGALPDSQIQILIDEDATKQRIMEAMDQTFGQAGPNDLALLYFSGHGLKGSFLPFDFDGFNNKLFHEEINDVLRRSPAKYKLCIADACHSGSLLAMRSGDELPTLLSYYESLAKAQSGTALIMSSKSDETSLESSGLRQGVFSHFLIRGLKGEADTDNNGFVSVQELYDFVSRNVRTYTGNRQSPVIQGDYDRTMTVAVKR